jgi:hypothetical protein
MLAFATDLTVNTLFVSGQTFHIKETLKAYEGIWDPKTQKWALPAKYDTPLIRAMLIARASETLRLKRLSEKAVRKAADDWAKSPEGVLQRLQQALKLKALTGAFSWICCESCCVINWEKQYTSCQVHSHSDGQSPNTFRVRGAIYTGD